MRKIAFALALIATPAAAQDFYGAVRAGQSYSEDGYGHAADDENYGLALGADFGALRFEAGAQQANGAMSIPGLPVGFVDATDYSLSAFGDLPLGSRFTLFAGGGVDYLDGESAQHIFGFRQDLDVSQWGYHVAGGAAFALTPNITGEVQYRRLEVSELPVMPDRSDGELTLDTVTLGARIGF